MTVAVVDAVDVYNIYSMCGLVLLYYTSKWELQKCYKNRPREELLQLAGVLPSSPHKSNNKTQATIQGKWFDLLPVPKPRGTPPLRSQKNLHCHQPGNVLLLRLATDSCLGRHS